MYECVWVGVDNVDGVGIYFYFSAKSTQKKNEMKWNETNKQTKSHKVFPRSSCWCFSFRFVWFRLSLLKWWWWWWWCMLKSLKADTYFVFFFLVIDNIIWWWSWIVSFWIFFPVLAYLVGFGIFQVEIDPMSIFFLICFRSLCCCCCCVWNTVAGWTG